MGSPEKSPVCSPQGPLLMSVRGLRASGHCQREWDKDFEGRQISRTKAKSRVSIEAVMLLFSTTVLKLSILSPLLSSRIGFLNSQAFVSYGSCIMHHGSVSLAR
jgi:hypothetical protein